MNIIVCVKEIVDPEATAEFFTLDTGKKALVPSAKVNRVLNPFDEQAVEAALRIKDKASSSGDKVGVKVTIMSMGNKLDRVVMKKPLNMGADELVLLEDDAFAGGDSWATAQVLAAAVKKIGEYDLILCGRQAADSNAGQTGLGIAEFLGIPCVTVARKIDITESGPTVERVITNGYETVELSLPAVITVSNELGQARYPSIKNIAKSNAIKPIIWTPADIGMGPEACGTAARKLTTLKLFEPVFDSTCEIVTGDTPAEAGQNLAVRLRAERVL